MYFMWDSREKEEANITFEQVARWGCHLLMGAAAGAAGLGVSNGIDCFGPCSISYAS